MKYVLHRPALVRQKRRRGKAKCHDSNWEPAVRQPNVTLGRGVNVELSQETTEMTTGASLISLQPYRAPCPRYKCHLSPRDWDRKPSRSSCRKHHFGNCVYMIQLHRKTLASVKFCAIFTLLIKTEKTWARVWRVGWFFLFTFPSFHCAKRSQEGFSSQ